MNRETNNQEIPPWDEIEKRVVESFDLNDVGTNYAVSRWREHVEKVRSVEDAGEIAYRFSF